MNGEINLDMNENRKMIKKVVMLPNPHNENEMVEVTIKIYDKTTNEDEPYNLVKEFDKNVSSFVSIALITLGVVFIAAVVIGIFR